MDRADRHYQADILGDGYEQLTLDFPDDEEGKVIATLVRKKSPQSTHKAILYIHGFIDYFFQTEMAEQFNQHGFDFYALDLRKYGRSHLAHQKQFYVKDLREYDAEITEALNIIVNEGHSSIVLAGHSTGGLTTTLYASHYPENKNIKALWVNSPFYDFNMSTLKKKIVLPHISKLGKKFPNLKFPSDLNPWYVHSLHQEFKGEWDFNLNWKPTKYPKVYLSFVHAIHEAHKELHAGPKLNIPVLVMRSAKTKNPTRFNRDVQNSDVILDVNDMRKYAKKLQGDVTVMTFKNGVHDLVLSKEKVRHEVYQHLFKFLKSKKI